MTHRVLIIDDSKTVLASLSGALRGDGYDVETLDRFMDLARTLARFCPNVIILDLNMPGFSGIQFARFVHEFCDDPPPIILHSGSDPSVVRIASREIRPFEVLPKGSSTRELRRAVGRAVAETRGWASSVRHLESLRRSRELVHEETAFDRSERPTSRPPSRGFALES